MKVRVITVHLRLREVCTLLWVRDSTCVHVQYSITMRSLTYKYEYRQFTPAGPEGRAADPDLYHTFTLYSM